ncbi:uncharacterized protein LOC141619233 [Silene latifolia]|uniref:uncharacterized protein LOC141619233 n=1 Tax=Silene latifolia TaxID=37657 RepID=UPI003D774D12
MYAIHTFAFPCHCLHFLSLRTQLITIAGLSRLGNTPRLGPQVDWSHGDATGLGISSKGKRVAYPFFIDFELITADLTPVVPFQLQFDKPAPSQILGPSFYFRLQLHLLPFFLPLYFTHSRPSFAYHSSINTLSKNLELIGAMEMLLGLESLPKESELPIHFLLISRPIIYWVWQYGHRPVGQQLNLFSSWSFV